MSAIITSGAEQWARDTAAKSERARSASANLRDATITPVDLGYDPFPKQQQFHASPAKYRLFGGAAGPGKSKALLMEAILQAHEHPGANTLLLRRTFSELEQSLLLYFRRDIPRELYKSFNDSKHVVTWHNGSTTRFGYCLAENDVYQYQGAEFLFIGIDELTLFTLRQWQFLTSRNRCPVPGAFPCMAAATNPGNIGHAWVKALWIDKQAAPGMENPGEYDPADYDFIPARVTDNPIYAADENYLKTLRALPSHLKRAFLDGDWDVFAGQYFDKFDHTRHVARAEEIDWKPWWPRWISIDWGFEHYAATYWHAAVPGAAAPVDGRHSERSLPVSSSPSVASAATEPADAVEESLLDVGPGNVSTMKRDPSAPSRARENRGKDETARDSARDDSSQTIIAAVEGQGFSPDTTDRREAPSSLPKAVQEGLPGRRLVEPGRSVEGPQRHASDVAASTTPNPAAKIADENRRREEAAPRFPRRPRSWLGFAGTIPGTPPESPASSASSRAENSRCVVSYREYVTHRTPPRELAREIVRRSVHSASPQVEGQGFSPDITDRREAPIDLPASTSRRPGSPSALPKAPFSSSPRERTFSSSASGPEKIDAIYLSPDAFARRTDEASIAEQMGDIFAAAGLPRPIPADDDRIGGWMLMYQMLDAGEWLLTENCTDLIRTLPNLIRDPARVEDIEKMDGDDAADAARYGLKSRYGAHRVAGEHRMPLTDRIAARVVSDDPTIRAMQARKAQIEETRHTKPVKFPHRRRPHHR
jgi:Terminase large subunit, T4likevirus-type, N-terminal